MDPGGPLKWLPFLGLSALLQEHGGLQTIHPFGPKPPPCPPFVAGHHHDHDGGGDAKRQQPDLRTHDCDPRDRPNDPSRKVKIVPAPALRNQTTTRWAMQQQSREEQKQLPSPGLTNTVPGIAGSVSLPQCHTHRRTVLPSRMWVLTS